jgi:hypothetical protein
VKKLLTVRQAARNRQPLDGADAQALEGALQQCERDLNEALDELEFVKNWPGPNKVLKKHRRIP